MKSGKRLRLKRMTLGNAKGDLIVQVGFGAEEAVKQEDNLVSQ